MNKKDICKNWSCNLAQAFLALMGEALLRYSNDYAELEEVYEFEKRDLLVAYYLAAQQKMQISKQEQGEFERVFRQAYENAPVAKILFNDEGFFELEMPLMSYKGDWRLEMLQNERGETEYFVQAFFGMRGAKRDYSDIPAGWELETSGEGVKLQKKLLDSLEISVPLLISRPLTFHVRAQVLKISPEKLILSYQSERGEINISLKAE